MNILGLSFDYHDAAAAIVVNGEIIAAAEEERFSRKKHDSSLPKLSMAFCLEEAGISASDLDAIIFYEKPLMKFSRIIASSFKTIPFNTSFASEALENWIKKGKFRTKERIYAELEIKDIPYVEIEHHLSHAASAYYTSPFQESTIVTLDGLGEYETATVSLGKQQKIKKLYSVKLPHSIGLFYSAFTAFLGFEVNEGEYKVMGMAGFGEAIYVDKIRELYTLEKNGTFRFNQKHFNFSTPSKDHLSKSFISIFGESRTPESHFTPPGFETAETPTEVIKSSKYYADIAASIQMCTEEIIMYFVEKAVERTGIKNVCLAGGVALNSAANGRIIREKDFNMYIHPSAGDAGGALGAALHYYHHTLSNKRTPALTAPYLGKSYKNSEIEQALKRAGLDNWELAPSKHSIVETTAKHLSQGKVIGWLQGRFEWGPRALGNRSILADPSNPNMKEIVNEKIKFREPFRPFAPSVLEDRAADFFEFPTPYGSASPEYFMLAIAKVREQYEKKLPAITHLDRTARIQLVSRETNELYYSLIKQFCDLTDIPILLNTSFNLRGEPMVSSPRDAVKTFSWSNMDYLVMENYIVAKSV